MLRLPVPINDDKMTPAGILQFALLLLPLIDKQLVHHLADGNGNQADPKYVQHHTQTFSRDGMRIKIPVAHCGYRRHHPPKAIKRIAECIRFQPIGQKGAGQNKDAAECDNMAAFHPDHLPKKLAEEKHTHPLLA
ncbi:hypothetical protein D3C81_1563120 [compost metagenome]